MSRIGWLGDLAKGGSTAAQAGRYASDLAVIFKNLDSTAIKNVMKTVMDANPETFSKIMKNMNPITSDMTDALKKMNTTQLQSITKNMDEVDKLDFIKKIDAVDPSLAKRMDPDYVSKTSKLADDAKDVLKANSKKLITAGLVFGAYRYLENKYSDAEEDIKNCVGICLPENWDDHKFGTLKKSELTYRELDEDDEGYDKNQPLCTKTMTDCGKYCGDKCEDIYDYDLPGSNVIKGAADDAAEGAGGLFSGLFKGLGLDGVFGDTGTASKISSVMSVIMILLALMRVVK
tara:strand:+ start:243 stop:1109 length:867 start_codon:yes stop_codon:yes gene_type:complete